MSSRRASTANAARGPPPARSAPATTQRTTAPARSAPVTAATTGSPPAPAAPTAPTQTPPTATIPISTPQIQASSPPGGVPAEGPLPPPIPPPPIFTDTVNELIIISDSATYNKLLTDVGSKHLLVEFYAPWCGACMLINRKLEELATTYTGKLIIAKVNVEDCEQIAIDNDVSMMPSFMLLKEKQVLEKFAGSNEEKLTSTIKKHVGEPTNAEEETNEV